MGRLTDGGVLELLQRLSRFWVLWRKSLVQEIRTSLEDAEQEYNRRLEACCEEKRALSAELEVFMEQSRELEESRRVASERLDFITGLLAVAPPPNAGLERFSSLLHDEFMEFSANASVAEEARAVIQLQALEKELELLVGYPRLLGKRVVAVGGGFSSGKSEFVNSFIQTDSVRLSVGIEPVTAIPAYVMCSEVEEVRAYGAKGGSMALPEEIYRDMSHKFVQSFSFNLKDIMPFVSYGVPMESQLFRELCLVDTPGYDPGGGAGFTEADRKSAMDFAAQSEAVIWLTAVDGKAPIESSDIDFLEELIGGGEKDLFVLANKAELRAPGDRDAIIRDIEDVCLDAGLPLKGVCAYSALEKKEYSYSGVSLRDFLESINNPVESGERIAQVVSRVFDKYRQAFSAEENRARRVHKEVDSASVHLLKKAGRRADDKAQRHFRKIKDDVSGSGISGLKEQADKLEQAFCEAVYEALAEARTNLARQRAH